MLLAPTLHRFVIRAGLAIVIGAVVHGAAFASDWYVDVNAPPGGDGSQSKPFQKIGDALNKSADGDRILVSQGTYPELLKVQHSVAILGEQGATTTISGLSPKGTPVSVSAGQDVWLQDLELLGDSALKGGGLHNGGTVVVVRCHIQGISKAGGGGVYNGGTMVMWGCVIDRCVSEGAPGGGIWNAGTLKLFNSTIDYNIAYAPGVYGGGGIAYGGGIYSTSAPITPDVSVLRLVNVTIYRNTASGDTYRTPGWSYGGGIYALGKVWIDHSTISYNYADSAYYGYTGWGGGFYGVEADVTHSVFAYNDEEDFDGICNSHGYLLIQDPTSTNFQGDMTGVQKGGDPLLLPLADYGGLVPTQALDPTSPCIDTGNPDPLASPAYDARGYPRALWDPSVGPSDLGAYEYGSTPSFLLTATPDIPLPPNANVALTTGGGIGFQPFALTLVEVNGSPLFVPVVVSNFDQSGIFELEATIPPGLSGLTAGFRNFSLDANDKLEVTNEALMVFQ